nr:hypothetical protein [Chitinophagaceae bacterium]
MDKSKQPALQEVSIGGEVFNKISNVQEMRPFFMSIVSDSNHWLFVSSNGGISAGRKNSEYALFPYYTDDKIVDYAEITGSKTIIRNSVNGLPQTWEPFSSRSEILFTCQRNIYKSIFGNKIIFEEINETLGLTFRYEWNTSNLYGFVRRATLVNHSSNESAFTVLDGLQNILPYGVGPDLQNTTSVLADAYKRSELLPASGLGIFALSAIIVDKAEPSEALKANTVWSLGLPKPQYLLSSLQLQAFRQRGEVSQEEDVKGERGAYFMVSDFTLKAGEEKEWMMVANVNQNHAAIITLDEQIKNDDALQQKVLDDIHLGTETLIKLVAAADGLQSTSDRLKDTRHFSNVLFNIMRGGIFDDNYKIEKWDFAKYLQKANRKISIELNPLLDQLPEIFSVFELKELAAQSGNMDFMRLSTEYLPLKFSRRHGDPSRPWNQFSINTRSETDGSKILDYQGNWRDIFQNWEALAHAYPSFMEGMIFKFLNASTFDGYNPYRVTKDGFDWETIEPDNPWSYIGYWGDHQIIYLLKFFEFYENHTPGGLQQWLAGDGFVYANVPYRIKPYSDILRNPKDTILFDHHSDRQIHERMAIVGADGALLTNKSGQIHHVSFIEKILATVLSKLSNLVPEGGIWMNTQRPEWNDANNALVGNGLSMVTLNYLRRFLKFFEPILQQAGEKQAPVSVELKGFFEEIAQTFQDHLVDVENNLNNAKRKQITDALGIAGSNFRNKVYDHGFEGKKENITVKKILDCFGNAMAFLEQAIRVNKRQDNLYHTYNLISYDEKEAHIGYLSEMLEGQVAVLSSGYLSATESLHVLDALKNSSLYRKDQYSYILYPNKNLPGFLQKNNIPRALADQSALLKKLQEDGNLFIVEKDIKGDLHFNGNFRNANDLEAALQNLNPVYLPLVEAEKALLLRIFEEVFRHKEFTGRSGTFYGYEGLGSIYWHMVSKLLLAVQETCLRAIEEKADKQTIDRLVQHYYDINEGIGVHKPPQLYGAFPTDPYSHTPFGKGAQQPGMTGQVKEDILCRIGELGICIKDGKLHFNPVLLKRNEFNAQARMVHYADVNGMTREVEIGKNEIFFTYCQVPVIYTIAGKEETN